MEIAVRDWREHRQDYYEKNSASLLEYQRLWYIKNRDRILAKRRERYNAKQLQELLARSPPQPFE